MSQAGVATLHRALFAVLLAALAAQAHAQDTRTQRDREALRRAHAMVQQARGELDTLRAEKEVLLKEKETALGLAREAQTKLDAAQRDSAALRAESARMQSRLTADLKQQTQTRSEEAAAARQQQQELQGQLADLRREHEHLVRLNANLVSLLERRTAELADLRQRNAALHGLAIEAVERYRHKSLTDMAHQDDPLFGLSRVRTENTAEDLRMRIDAQRSAAP